DYYELVVRDAGDGEVTGNAAALADQGRQASAADGCRNAVRQNGVQPAFGARALHAVLGVVRNVDHADFAAQHPHFAAHRLPPVLTLEADGFFGRFAVCGEPQRMLPAVIETEDA